MRCLILYAALFGAVAGYRHRPAEYSTYKPAIIETTIKPDVTTLKIETPTTEAATTTSITHSTTPSTTTSSTTKKYKKESSETTSSTSSQTPQASSSETNLLEPVTDLPITLPPLLPQLPNNRHVVTYDQRQEGQYNIRADLDNFMIILVPPSPTQGLGLLDLLTKSSLRRATPQTNKSKKKHYLAAASLNSLPSKQYGYYPQHEHQQQQLVSRAAEFIDGRTPYHVDISSLNEDKIQPRLSPDKQVDVLPPPYPLAYQHHLMKPYHLEAESSLLPPSEIGHADSAPSDHNTGYYRFARYIRGDNFLDSNSLTSSNRIATAQQPYIYKPLQKLPVYRPENSMGAAEMYPPLDVPKFNEEEARNFDSDDNDVHSDNFAGELGDDVDLAFIDDTILEDRHKTAYSDEIERCAPGKRRDSYGVCREIEVY